MQRWPDRVAGSRPRKSMGWGDAGSKQDDATLYGKSCYMCPDGPGVAQGRGSTAPVELVESFIVCTPVEPISRHASYLTSQAPPLICFPSPEREATGMEGSQTSGSRRPGQKREASSRYPHLERKRRARAGCLPEPVHSYSGIDVYIHTRNNIYIYTTYTHMPRSAPSRPPHSRGRQNTSCYAALGPLIGGRRRRWALLSPSFVPVFFNPLPDAHYY